MDTKRLVEDVLKKRTWKIRDNSNIQISPSQMDYYISSQAKKEYVLKRLYSKEVSKAHEEGSIYIHTLHSPFRPYCNGIDPRIFLLDGLKFPNCVSAPAKHFSSAVYQSMAFLFYSQMFFGGAQAMDYYNWFLAPYVHFDCLTYKEVKQIIQGFVYQLNESNRLGGQATFTNIGLRIKCPSYLQKTEKGDVHVIYAGKKLREDYSSFEREARMIYRAFMEVMMEGDGSGAPFTFPIITTAITKDWDWNDPLVELTMKTASSKGSPYFFNLTTDYLNEKYIHAMCCHLLIQHSGGVWQAGGIGTGSNKVVTLNLPHIALLAGGESKFFSVLEKKMELARKALQESNKIIKKSLDEWKLLPFLKKKVDDIYYYNFKERKLTFGVVGLNECLLNLIKKPLTSREGLSVGLKIIQRMSVLARRYSKEDGVMYTLEQTPAETCSHKLAVKDKKRFGRKAHVQGSGIEVYYTNSTHVPYNSKISLFEKIDIESKFHPLFNGGVITHIWMGESHPNSKSMKSLVKKLSKTQLAYFTFSPDFSVCSKGHVTRGVHKKCPECGSQIVDHINRVVGFFTRTSAWNPGKQREYRDRNRYKLK